MIEVPTLSSKMVAEKLGIHVNTVWKLVKQEKLKAYRYGKGYKFFPADVEKYIKSTEQIHDPQI